MLGEVESVGVCIRTHVNVVDALGFDLVLCSTFMMTLVMIKNETNRDEKDRVIQSCLVAKQETCHQR